MEKGEAGSLYEGRQKTRDIREHLMVTPMDVDN
jgi:hypothetical protein